MIEAGAGIACDEDGVARCSWCMSAPDYQDYHDQEWGRPVHGEVLLFERITLEAFQSGLSWLTILRKRDAFRDAFDGFDPTRVAAYTHDDIERLMGDARIVRNRRKIEATITNARAVLALQADGLRLEDVFWQHMPKTHRRPSTLADIPTQTPESVRLSRDLKGRGFAHIGPTTMYAAMQACGVVNDHVTGCHVVGGQDPA